MTAVGGSMESCAIDGRTFAIAADADGTRKLGGFENEVQANGDGSARIVKTRVPWSMAGLEVEIQEDRDDQAFLQEKADSKDFFKFEVTFASGDTYAGRATIVDAIDFSSQKATAPLSLMGPDKLEKQ